MALKTWLEIPFAILSFGFYKANKFVIGNLYTLYLSRNKKNTKEWRIISEDLLKKPLSLSVLMTKAPRWNTNAIIGTLGPISVEKELTINLDTIRSSTESWVGCVYDFPGYKTVADFTPLNDDPSQSTLKISLPKGKYTVGLRYYHAKEDIRFPVVNTDTSLEIPELKVSPEINDFYKTLAQKTNFYFRCLHYYLFTIFKLRHLLPENFVKYEFLPVGATDTQFFFGCLDPSERLEIKIPESWQGQEESLHDAPFSFYLNFYNRASFPLHWQQLTEDTLCKPLNEEGYYLIRMRPNSIEAAKVMAQISHQEMNITPNHKQLAIK